MALQALAPYYNSEKDIYIRAKSIEKTVTKHVYDVIDEVSADFPNCNLTREISKVGERKTSKSTDQVMVALCCLGIDPLTDKRFIKRGILFIDGILRYRMKDLRFRPFLRLPPPIISSSLPTRQIQWRGNRRFYTMAALIRREKGSRTLYDFRSNRARNLIAHFVR